MGLFSSYRTEVSTHVTNIFEQQVDVRLNAVMTALASDGYFLEHLPQEFINGTSQLINTYKKYATDHAPGSIPVDRLVTVVPDKSVVAEFLGEYEQKLLNPVPAEPPEVTVTDVLLQSGNYDFFAYEYVFKEYGFDPYTSRIKSYPDNLNESLLNYYEQRVAAYRTELDSYLPDLFAQVPEPSSTLRTVNRNGETMTHVVEWSYDASDSVVILPSENRFGRLVNWDKDGSDAKSNLTYTLNFEAVIEVKASGKAVVEYVPQKVEYYLDSEGNKHDYTTTLLPAVVDETGVKNFSDTTAVTFSENFEPAYIPHDRYYYIEYYVNKPDGTKEPKILVFSEDTTDTDYRGFPTYGRTTAQTDAEDWEVNYYLPSVRLRSDNVDLLEDKDSDYYKYAQGQLQTLGIGVDELQSALNSSPDIESIDEAFFTLGFDVNTDNEASKIYIAEFFNYIHREFSNQIESFNYDGLLKGMFSRLRSDLLDYTLVIDQEGFKNELRFKGIQKKVIQGRISNNPLERCIVEVKKVNDDEPYSLVINHQIDSDTYREIVVYDLRHISYVFRKHKVETVLEDIIDNPLENRIILPFNVTIFEKLPAIDRERAVNDSFKLVMHAYERTKLKWYQSGLFKAIVVVLAIAITVYTGFDAVSTASAIMTASGTMAAVKYLTVLILTKLVTYYAISYVVQMLGPELAIFAAVALLIYSGGQSLDQFTSVAQLSSIDLLNLSLNISKAASAEIADQMDDLNKEMEAFLDEQIERAILIEETEDKLYGENLLRPYASLPTSPILSFNESPSRFLERTGQINNPGAQSIDAIGSYVEAVLNKGRIRGIK